MKLKQSFEVTAPVDRVWHALVDVEHVAPCLPGAAVTGRNDDGSYNGVFTVKIGPTSASYAGKLLMDMIDEDEHAATMHAHGSDKRGQGGAKATILSTLSPTQAGGTRVEVVTEYYITGRLARFGRSGMMEDISERLLREFARRLQATLAAPADVGHDRDENANGGTGAFAGPEASGEVADAMPSLGANGGEPVAPGHSVSGADEAADQFAAEVDGGMDDTTLPELDMDTAAGSGGRQSPFDPPAPAQPRWPAPAEPWDAAAALPSDAAAPEPSDVDGAPPWEAAAAHEAAESYWPPADGGNLADSPAADPPLPAMESLSGPNAAPGPREELASAAGEAEPESAVPDEPIEPLTPRGGSGVPLGAHEATPLEPPVAPSAEERPPAAEPPPPADLTEAAAEAPPGAPGQPAPAEAPLGAPGQPAPGEWHPPVGSPPPAWPRTGTPMQSPPRPAIAPAPPPPSWSHEHVAPPAPSPPVETIAPVAPPPSWSHEHVAPPPPPPAVESEASPAPSPAEPVTAERQSPIESADPPAAVESHAPAAPPAVDSAAPAVAPSPPAAAVESVPAPARSIGSAQAPPALAVTSQVSPPLTSPSVRTGALASPAAVPPGLSASAAAQGSTIPPSSEPIEAFSLVGSVLWGQIRRNPAPAGFVAGVVVTLLMRRGRRPPRLL